MSYKPSTPISILSTGNTFDLPIIGGATFTGIGELNDYPSVMVQVSTDQIGILYIEFSQDNVNWDTSLSFQYNTSRINPPHIFEKGQRYFRVRFTNSSVTDQTYFRLNTTYGSFEKLTAPINGTLAENFDAIVVRPTDYNSEVAMGKRQGRKTWNKWGFNDDVDTGSEEILASWGGTVDLPTTSETIDFVSTSVNDTSGGTGMNSVVIYGIDSNREELIEVLTLNGTTPVTSVNTFYGVNRLAPFLCGTSQQNEGTVTGTQSTSSKIIGQIPLGLCSTQQCIFYVQNNHQFLLSNVIINIIKLTGGGGQPEVTIRGYVFSPVANANIQVYKKKMDTQRENTIDDLFSQPFPITEDSILYFTAETDTNNTSVDVRFSGIEERII